MRSFRLLFFASASLALFNLVVVAVVADDTDALVADDVE